MVAVSDALTYNEALTILGRNQSRLVAMLDTVLTAGLAASATRALVTGNDPAMFLSLLELKSDIVAYGNAIVRKATEWRRGLSRFDRSHRLAAAHAVIVVSSFFEALERAELPVPLERFGLTSAEETSLATAHDLPRSYPEIINLLLREPIPSPEPHRSFDAVCQELLAFYDGMSKRVMAFISGLAVWEKQLDSGQQRQLGQVINSLPNVALVRYQDAYRELANDSREFEVWANLTEMHALGASLSGITAMLEEMAVPRPGSRPHIHLARSYQAALANPIAGVGQAPGGITLPSLGEAYMNPRCRVAEIRPGDTPASAEWWTKQRTLPDIEEYLAGYLVSLRAVRSPLVILGEPGSGKSKLMEVLAARLPEQHCLPVLVSLRDVAAESMIQEQIEQAVYRGPGERVRWHDLLDAAESALPVVLLDGFDELVQAASLNRYDYLEQVCDFQRRQAQIGRPVAVIVTSRTVVADYVRFPVASIVLQLQPFDEAQIRRWLDVWARSNTTVLADRGLRPLPAERALAHGDLAEQPLLLMMLAIFDSSSNALQREDTRIGHAGLYERLMTDFALREVLKSAHGRSLSTREQHELAEREVQRLAAVAVAMFTRGRQWITETELNRDLAVLFPENDTQDLAGDTVPSSAQRATGRFFFVHKAEARSRDTKVRSYEFLHSTFSEFLVARTVISALRSLTAVRDTIRRAPSTAGGRLDDGLLYGPLSFSCLAVRTAIIGFLREQLQEISEDILASFKDMLMELIGGSLLSHSSRSLQDYEPVREPLTRRLAAYSANLVLTLVLISSKISGELRVSEFCGDARPADTWHQYGFLWRGGLTAAEWRGLLETIRARVCRDGRRVDIRLTVEDGSSVSPLDSLLITSSIPENETTHFDVILSTDNPVSYDAQFSASSQAGRIFRDAAFLPSWHSGMNLLQSLPMLRALSGEIRKQSTDGAGLLPGYLLATLDFTRNQSLEGKMALYNYCISKLRETNLYDEVALRLRSEALILPIPEILSLVRNMRSRLGSQNAILSIIIAQVWHRPDAEDYQQEIMDLAAGLI